MKRSQATRQPYLEGAGGIILRLHVVVLTHVLGVALQSVVANDSRLATMVGKQRAVWHTMVPTVRHSSMSEEHGTAAWCGAGRRTHDRHAQTPLGCLHGTADCLLSPAVLGRQRLLRTALSSHP